MWKKIIIITMLLVFLPKNIYGNEITVLLDNKKIEFDQKPIIYEDKTYVPFRAILEAMGYDVDWIAKENMVSAVKYDGLKIRETYINLKLNNMVSLYTDYENEDNNITNYTDFSNNPALIINDRTLIPLRLLSETLGFKVDWIGSSRTVLIDSSNPNMINNSKRNREPLKPKSEISNKNINENIEIDKIIKDTINDLNKLRASLNHGPLAIDNSLMKISQLKVDEMVEYDYFDHTSPVNGLTPTELARQEGYDKNIGELILQTSFYDGLNSNDILNLWKDSKPHYDTMTDGKYKYIGLAYNGNEEIGYTFVMMLSE